MGSSFSHTPEGLQARPALIVTSSLFAALFGPERGIGCRATIGVMSLANNHCFETWMDLEVA